LASDSSSVEAGVLVVVGIVGNVEVVEVRGIGVEGGGVAVVVVFAGVVEGYMCLAVCNIHCYPCCFSRRITQRVMMESFVVQIPSGSGSRLLFNPSSRNGNYEGIIIDKL
jgi:hypothetical protein